MDDDGLLSCSLVKLIVEKNWLYLYETNFMALKLLVQQVWGYLFTKMNQANTG